MTLGTLALVLNLLPIVELFRGRPHESIAASGLSTWCLRQGRGGGRATVTGRAGA